LSAGRGRFLPPILEGGEFFAEVQATMAPLTFVGYKLARDLPSPRQFPHPPLELRAPHDSILGQICPNIKWQIGTDLVARYTGIGARTPHQIDERFAGVHQARWDFRGRLRRHEHAIGPGQHGVGRFVEQVADVRASRRWRCNRRSR
jgi:hypothetical protein